MIGYDTMEEVECTEARKDLATLEKKYKENNVAEDMENETGKTEILMKMTQEVWLKKTKSKITT